MNHKQPTSLVKFADADTGQKILAESKLRWSAPCLFDDPFELDHLSKLNYDAKTLLVASVKSTLSLLFSRDEPRGTSPIMKAVRRWRSENRFDSEEEAQEILNQLLKSMVAQREPEVEQMVKDWGDYARSLRILCLSDSHEAPHLWQQHANNHNGIAIRFACGEDTSLEKPVPVSYTETKPEISPLLEQIDILMNQLTNKVQETFPEKFSNKSKLNNKDREWRIFKSVDMSTNPDDANSNSWYEEISFEKSEVRAVYFGAKIDPAKIATLQPSIESNYPTARIFQAIPKPNRFELEFERLNPN